MFFAAKADFYRAAQVAISWAEAEGWNPGLGDDSRYLAADPDAFIATERGGEVVGTVSCALYGDSYAFVGFYIVRPGMRGRGIGSGLFERALARADGRVVGLDGVLAQQASYARRGFVLAHRNVRWRTVGGGECPAGLIELSSVPVEQLLAFDSAVFGAERERFLGPGSSGPAVTRSPACKTEDWPATECSDPATWARRSGRCSPTTRTSRRRC